MLLGVRIHSDQPIDDPLVRTARIGRRFGKAGKYSRLNFEKNAERHFRQRTADFGCEFQDRPQMVCRQDDDADLSARGILLVFQLLI